MASTLAGNFTVLGSIANLIVVRRAAVSGVEIGFWDYFKVGAPLTLRSGPPSPRSPWAFTGAPNWRGAWAATPPSIMPAMSR